MAIGRDGWDHLGGVGVLNGLRARIHPVIRACAHRLKPRRSLERRVQTYFGDRAALAVREQVLSEQIRQLDVDCGYTTPGAARFVWPVSGQITSPFGERFGRMHYGVDIAAPTGVPVHSAGEGRVLSAEWLAEYGNTIIISHGRGFTTLYAHQSRFLTGVGEIVHAGQPIGLVGSSGRATGPHLHFETRIDAMPCDPSVIIERSSS